MYCSNVPDRSINCAVTKTGIPLHLTRPDPDVQGSSSGRPCIGQTKIKDPFITQYQQFLHNIVLGLITFLKVYENLTTFLLVHTIVVPCSGTQQLQQLNAA